MSSTSPCCKVAQFLVKIQAECDHLKKLNIELIQENERLRHIIANEENKVLKEDTFLLDVKEAFKDFLTPAQVEKAMGVKKKVNWTEGAFGIR